MRQSVHMVHFLKASKDLKSREKDFGEIAPSPI